jgi:hypothetical protein
MSIFDVHQFRTGIFTARLLGVDMMGIGFVCWMSSKSKDRLVSEVILGLFVADLLGSIVMLVGQLNKIMNPLGWINALIWMCLTFGLGYYRFIKPPKS